MMSIVRQFFIDENGASAAEFALILPISVLLLFSGLETGHYFYQQHQIVKAVRDGARYAARQSFDDVNCRGTATISNTVVANVRTLTRTGQLSGGPSRISNWADNDIDVSVTCPTTTEAETGLYDSGEPATQVTVSTQINYDSLFNGLGIITDNFRIGASQQATVMGI